MVLSGKKLGLLLSGPPQGPGFAHGLRLAEKALDRGAQVYLYCLDDAVTGLERLQPLKARGARVFACAYAAQRRQVPPSDLATFAGLGVVSDLMAGADRFLHLP